MDFTIFNQTELEEMFQAMIEHMPEETRQIAINDFLLPPEYQIQPDVAKDLIASLKRSYDCRHRILKIKI